jgi:general secretion pathway protein D
MALSAFSRQTVFLCGVLSALCFVPPVFVWGQAPGASGFSNYQNTPVNSILDIYEQLSGKHLVRDANLSGVPPISINASGLTRAEMLKLVEATLLLNGIAIVPIDDQTVKIVTIGTNKNPRSEGVKLYANAADLPVNDEVVSYYMPLSYISAQEAQTIFTQDAPVHIYGAYVVAPSAQAVILTENVSVIRELIALKELIDVPPARVDTEFVQLNRADAQKVADLLTKLLNPQGAPAGGASPSGNVVVPAALGGLEPLRNEHNLLSGTVQIVPDLRSNRLLVITRPVNMPFLRQIIGELDRPDTFAVPARRELKYVLAEDILPALEAALAQGKDEEDQLEKDKTATSTTNPSQAQTASTTNPSSAGTSGSSSNVSSVTAPLQAPPQNNVPTVVTIGKTRILADNRSNSIIVFGSTDAVERVFSMIDELDRKPLQVYLATVIGELTLTKEVQFGIDLLQKYQHVGSVGAATGLVTPGTASTGSSIVPEPSGLLTSTGFPLTSGLTIYGAIGNTLDAYVRALQTTDRFKVISRPSVYTTNNKLAVIASGSQVPVPSNTTSGFTGSSTLATTSNITYEDVLLQLDIIPLINANHQVTLKIRQTNNTLGASQVISGNSIPTILTQEINTEVTIPDRSTIVIGGLISDNDTRDESGVPFLSDIPLLGYLFKDTDKKTERDELIIMIQPTVVETDADQVAVNEEEKQRTILGREAEEAASGIKTTTTITTTRTNASAGRNSDSKSIIEQSSEKNSDESLAPVAPNSVPAASTAAPDVGNGRMIKDNPPLISPTTP